MQMKRNGLEKKSGHFGSHAVLVEQLPHANVLHIRLDLDIRRAEAALVAEPDRKHPESFHFVPAEKRMAVAGLEHDLKEILLVLEMDPSNDLAGKALRLIEEHGNSADIRLVAKILIDKARSRVPDPLLLSEMPFTD